MLIPLDEVVSVKDVVTHSPTTGAVTDADSVPVYDVFEEDTDTPILAAQAMTKRTSKTGDYRGSFTASAANGFEPGKWYNVVVTATVSAVTQKLVSMYFRVAPAETVPGVPLSSNIDKVGYTLSAAGVDAVWDDAVDGVTTARQSLRLANSANGAKVSGAATPTITIRDLADTKVRVTASVDADGNRLAVTTDLS